MRAIWTALLRLLDPWRRRRRDARLDEEVADHLTRLRDDFLARGLSSVDADLAARRAFGGADQVTARYREQRGWPALDSLGQDLRFAGRYLMRDRAFAVPVVLVLALGIGVGHMFLTLTYAHVLRGLPIEDVERVVLGIDHRRPRCQSCDVVSRLRRPARLASSLRRSRGVRQRPRHARRRGAGARPLLREITTASGFAMTGVRPVIGRGLSAADDAPGAPPTVVLTERVWQNRYHGDDSVIGRDVLVNGAATTVIGVVSDRSGLPERGRRVPAARRARRRGRRGARRSHDPGVRPIGPRATRADAAADLEAIAGTLVAPVPRHQRGRPPPRRAHQLSLARRRGHAGAAGCRSSPPG